MKKYLFYISMISLLCCAGCKEEEIIQSKPGEPVDPVSALKHSIAGENVTLSWDLPASLPEDIVEPVSVQVSITVNGQNAGTEVLEDAPQSYTYSPYDPANDYRFTVKVIGAVDTTDPNVSGLRYSLGQTVTF